MHSVANAAPDDAALSLKRALTKETPAAPPDHGDAASTLEAPPAFGLALSGGGIRSATFGLGVLQALAAREKLATFDVLSTVSGGGFIGSCLSAWIHRTSLSKVQHDLGRFGSLADSDAPAAAEPEQVAWLRRYSNYLAPRVGLFSLDSLTLIAIWLRNFTLNAVVIVGFLLTLLLVPMVLIPWAEVADLHYIGVAFAAWPLSVMFVFTTGYNLWQQSLRQKRTDNWFISNQGVLCTVVLPAVLTCILLSAWLFQTGLKQVKYAQYAAAAEAIPVVLVFVVWAFAESLKPRAARLKPGEYVAIGLSGVTALLVCAAMLTGLYFGWHHLLDQATYDQRNILRLILGPPAVMLALGISTTVFTGMVGRAYFERSREWLSRLNAWLMTFGIGWLVWAGVSLMALPLLLWLASRLGGWIALIGTGWIGSLFAAIFARKPLNASRRAAGRIDAALNVAATVFIFGLMVVLSACIAAAVLVGLGDGLVDNAAVLSTDNTYRITAYGQLAFSIDALRSTPLSLTDLTAEYFDRLSATSIDHAMDMLVILLALVLVVTLFSWRVDINKFSLHNMYKNRLVRCYLGASNQRLREERPFVGLDDDDDFPLSALVTKGPNEQEIAQRPLHILNAALNISQGKNLAWQERKAASFIFSPLICGFSLARNQGDTTSLKRGSQPIAGYRPTAKYASKDTEHKGFTLGMAMATSGAAVSPHMGSASRSVRAFVLTLFNVRLGRWSANPAETEWERPSPAFGLLALLQELFGYSNETSKYVYLSDGGHFDNLGLYELIRRRCKTVLVVDAGTDPERQMEDLARTMRKCRIDFGVEIELPSLEELRGNEDKRASSGFTLGTIRYDIDDRSRDGALIIIKPTLTVKREEPADVIHYGDENPSFPHQSIGDQFFDESQFESYRRLGIFIGGQCLDAYKDHIPPTPLSQDPPEDPVDEKTKTQGPPTASTRFIASTLGLFGVKKAGYPPASGSSLDLHLSAAILCLGIVLAFAVVDILAMQALSVPCFSTSACLPDVERLMKTAEQLPVTKTVLVGRAFLDYIFALLYGLILISTYVHGTRKWRRSPRLRSAALVLLVVLAGAASLANIVEDVRWLTWSQNSENYTAAEIAVLVQLKFILVSLNLAAWIFLAYRHWPAFRARWLKKKERDVAEVGRH